MSRIHDLEPARTIGRALPYIPARIQELVKVEFMVAVDPIFTGIHKASDWTLDGSVYSYKDVAHCVLDVHQMHRPASDRNIKILLPSNSNYEWDKKHGLHTVIHEFGHAVQDKFDLYAHKAHAVTSYAETNNHEAFAEAFSEWCLGEPVDEETKALFERLAFN